jgi:hypothetical protein
MKALARNHLCQSGWPHAAVLGESAAADARLKEFAVANPGEDAQEML